MLLNALAFTPYESMRIVKMSTKSKQLLTTMKFLSHYTLDINI